MKLKRVGIDIAKQVFQVHGVDESEQVVVRKRLTRKQMLKYFAQLEPTLIGMEACGGSHYWARELTKLGHTVKLIPPQYVKPYVQTNKNDQNDAEGICEALSRPQMRFVPIKEVEQQEIQSLHRIRERVVKSRTALVNEIRGLLGEYGIVLGVGVSTVRQGVPRIVEDAENELGVRMRGLLRGLYEELLEVEGRLKELDTQVKAHAQSDAGARSIQAVEGIGVVSASAVVSSVGDARQFKSGREFAAWLGIVPSQHSTGGKARLGGISKRGDSRLRTLLIHGARAVVKASTNKSDRRSEWIKSLVRRRNKNIAAVAVANKNARIIWAMLTRGEGYRGAV